MNYTKRIRNKLLSLILVASLSLSSALCSCDDFNQDDTASSSSISASLQNLPEFDGETPYVELNGNVPYFEADEITTKSFESYSELDSLKRCGVAFACIGQDIMPTEKRGEIGQVKPSGWHTVRYDDLITDKYLYNRCHLIAYMLAGENANTKNLITGTRYFNVTGMLPFENQVNDYVKKTNNHVMYRVTPIFEGDDLVAKGATMEALSVEDNGEGVKFNVFVYNCQPGITIDYATGESWRTGEENQKEEAKVTYIINKNTNVFHKTDCDSVKSMKAQNRKETTASRKELIAQGCTPCKSCNP